MVGAGVGLAGMAPARAQAPPLRLRRIWLRLLLNQVEQDLQAGKGITDQARHFAGLTRVEYLYVDEEDGDLILEGPAEDSWQARPDGTVLGASSGRPLLELDDLAVAWRNGTDGSPPPSVSLEYQAESVRRIQEVIRGAQGLTTPAGREEFSKQLEEAWGPQDAVTGGVPQNTRFNKVMVDADWEMKRISLGHSDPGVEDFPTYVDLEFKDLRRRVAADGVNARRPAGGSRFWFFPAYREFARSEKSDAVAIPDNPVQLLTESHFRTLAKSKVVTPEPTPAAKQFVQAFTEKYGGIAEFNPLYADLRSLFDWVAIVRLIRLLDAPRRIRWDLGFLRRNFPVREVPTPLTMPGLVAVRHAEVKVRANQLANVVFPAWGGVSIDVDRFVSPTRLRVDRSLEPRLRSALAARDNRPGHWWQ